MNYDKFDCIRAAVALAGIHYPGPDGAGNDAHSNIDGGAGSVWPGLFFRGYQLLLHAGHLAGNSALQ